MTVTTAPRLCTQLCSLVWENYISHSPSVADIPFGTFKGNFATFLNYVPNYCGFPWAMKSQFLEKPTIGKH